MTDLVLRCGTILSMDDAVGDVADIDILVRAGRIAAIERGIDKPDAESVDLRGMLVMPGLVNAHLHTWQTALRATAGDWTLTEYSRRMHAGLAKAFKPDDIYIGNLVGALGQIDCGVTTLFDWSHNNPTPDHTDRAIDGLVESGIRAIFGHGTPKPDLDGNDIPMSEVLHPEEEVRRLRHGRLASDDGLVGLALCIRGPDLSSLEASIHDIALARKYGLLASAHVGGRMPATRKTPDGIRALAKRGLLGPGFNAVHANKLNDEELAVLAGSGASFTSTPEIEVQMGHGWPVIGRVSGLGVMPSIGTDVEGAVGTEMLAQARFALQVQRGLDNEATHATGTDVAALNFRAADALRWATIGGARALGIDRLTGSLTPGKAADIIALRLDDRGVRPAGPSAETALFHGNRTTVDMVMVAGRILKRQGRIIFSELQARLQALAASREGIFQRTRAH